MIIDKYEQAEGTVIDEFSAHTRKDHTELEEECRRLKQDAVELVEEFAAACDSAGVSQAGQISKMMTAFIEEQKPIISK